MNTEAARTAGLKIALTATNKAATVDLTTNRTRTPRADPTATNKVTMVEPTKNHTKTPRADTDDRTTPMEATRKAMVNPTTNRMETPRATTGDLKAPRVTTDGLKTPTEATEVVMVDPTATPMVERKLPTEAAPAVTSRRMITLTEATRKVTADPTITLVPMVDKRNAAAVRGVTVESLVFADFLQDMAVLEVMVLNRKKTAALMKPPVIVRDTNPHTSLRRTLTPLVPLTPPVIPTLGEVMVAVVRRKTGTPPAVT